ncbi:MAG: hypothetical protein ABIY70_03170 [Capsulimonas sp.]|uniref:hypothetical protein n=1 Tax=Capsulimonas sp. TaxID=2494211 RepID=UPI003264C83F
MDERLQPEGLPQASVGERLEYYRLLAAAFQKGLRRSYSISLCATFFLIFSPSYLFTNLALCVFGGAEAIVWLAYLRERPRKRF